MEGLTIKFYFQPRDLRPVRVVLDDGAVMAVHGSSVRPV
jgi:hypothetical protein